MVLAVIWILGLGSLGAVLVLQQRLDQRRQGQTAVALLRKQVSELTPMAFGSNQGQTRKQVQAQLTVAEKQITGTAASLTGFGGDGRDSRFVMAKTPALFALLRRVNALESSGRLRAAGVLMNGASRPGRPEAVLTTGFTEITGSYNREAGRARLLAVLGAIIGTVLMLVAFSLALRRAARLARDKEQILEQSRQDALTDQLTGLANRRRLFTDMDTLLQTPRSGEKLVLGMFDLNGFKAYNDTFGHPAGDALLARLASNLRAAIEGDGTAYRLGGDEFCVIARGNNAELALARAQESLSEHSDTFAITCSAGTVLITPDEMSLEDALGQADQRLYKNKRSSRTVDDLQARDMLVRVLSEGDEVLASPVSNVVRLATAVAQQLRLSEKEVALTRLTAELHDIGKTAIPETILNKPGPLDDEEWTFMRRHTLIGERILSAAPTLARIAPLVRSTHERSDGSGYPDGLSEDQIPLSARIVAVADAYDAMTAGRPYAPAVTREQATAELRRCAGTQFDPSVIDAFIAVLQAAKDKSASSPHDQTPIAA